VIQDLNLGLNAFNKLIANLNEGVNFYANLMKVKIEPLAQRVDDFVFARDMEKRMILDQLTKSLAGFEDEKSEPKPSSASNPNMSVESGSLYAPITPPTPSAPIPSSVPRGSNPFSQPPPTSYSQPSHYSQPTPPFNPYQQPHSQPHQPYQQPYQQPTPSSVPLMGTVPGAIPPQSQGSAPGSWNCSACTYLNTPTASACVMCGTGRAIVQVTQSKKKGWFG